MSASVIELMSLDLFQCTSVTANMQGMQGWWRRHLLNVSQFPTHAPFALLLSVFSVASLSSTPPSRPLVQLWTATHGGRSSTQ